MGVYSVCMHVCVDRKSVVWGKGVGLGGRRIIEIKLSSMKLIDLSSTLACLRFLLTVSLPTVLLHPPPPWMRTPVGKKLSPFPQLLMAGLSAVEPIQYL